VDHSEMKLGQNLTLISVTLANLIAQDMTKEDILILAAFISSISANLYVLVNTRLDLPGNRVSSSEGEAAVEI